MEIREHLGAGPAEKVRLLERCGSEEVRCREKRSALGTVGAFKLSKPTHCDVILQHRQLGAATTSTLDYGK